MCIVFIVSATNLAAVVTTFCCALCVVSLLHQSARGPRITGWYEDVSVSTAIYNLLPYNKIINVHDYVEWGLGKVRNAQRAGTWVPPCWTNEHDGFSCKPLHYAHRDILKGSWSLLISLHISQVCHVQIKTQCVRPQWLQCVQSRTAADTVDSTARLDAAAHGAC